MKQTGPEEAKARLEAKARQAAKIAEVHTALIVTGYRTIAEQAFALGVNRSTAWALLNHTEKAGPSAGILKRMLSSQNLPQEVRLKVEEYIKEKSAGRYAHHARRVRWFRDQFPAIASGNNGVAGHPGVLSEDVDRAGKRATDNGVTRAASGSPAGHPGPPRRQTSRRLISWPRFRASTARRSCAC